MPLYDYLTPKLDFKRKFNHRQSFLYKGRLTVRTIRKFRIGSSLRIESRIGSSIRNQIESRSFIMTTATSSISHSGRCHTSSKCDSCSTRQGALLRLMTIANNSVSHSVLSDSSRRKYDTFTYRPDLLQKRYSIAVCLRDESEYLKTATYVRLRIR